jgi:hypothetical protein
MKRDPRFSLFSSFVSFWSDARKAPNVGSQLSPHSLFKGLFMAFLMLRQGRNNGLLWIWDTAVQT